MESNFIVPVSSMFNNRLTDDRAQTQQSTQPFQAIFQNAMENVQTSNRSTNADATALALGNADALHQVTIASTQAELALKYFVQLRNKGHDAYSEIMRMGI